MFCMNAITRHVSIRIIYGWERITTIQWIESKRSVVLLAREVEIAKQRNLWYAKCDLYTIGGIKI